MVWTPDNPPPRRDRLFEGRETIQEPLDGTVEKIFSGDIPPGGGDWGMAWAVGNTGVVLSIEFVDYGRIPTWKFDFTPDGNTQGAADDADRLRYREVFVYGIHHLLTWLRQERESEPEKRKMLLDPRYLRKNPDFFILPKEPVVCYRKTNLRMFKFMQKTLGEQYVWIDTQNKNNELTIDIENMSQDEALLDKLNTIAEECMSKNYHMSVRTNHI